ncbi:glycosyltransferase [Actinocorallia sp. API 0066]|uniref:polysaccharide deacetylase family protein n=1 Tax=Actinocorallia sp. API 0066 TaxID=2896846 RepID=UPI001E5E8651|nr:polysaccharide deacetylase family protein [Actinocorallia sp. API 0066]MCD0448122.1 glycosyltransferase [Actinocorallia sp. API 0066]
MKHREPRAHWFLIGLGSFLLVLLLVFDGFVQGVVGEAKSTTPAGSGPIGPAEVTEGGPVVNTGQGETRSARMPEKTIALTFDDGPDPLWTPRILDVLAEYDAKASFFMIGGNVAAHPTLVQRVLDEGHEIGNHSYSHVDLATAPDWRIRLELSLTQRALAGSVGVKTWLMRMPYSGTPDGATEGQWRAAQVAGEEGYIVVFTDRDTRDWERPGVDFMVEEALKDTDDGAGAIIMLHDSGGDRSQTVQALREFIPQLQAKGYRFTTLAEALELPRAEVPASFRSQVSGKLVVTTQRAAAFAVDVLGILFLIGGALGLIRVVFLMVVAVRHARVTRRARKAPGMDDDPPSLTVIVPAFNEEVGIAATISSLRDTDFTGDLRIIVVDDGSTDRTAEIVRGLADSALTLVTKPNGGKASALNEGIRYAVSEIVVMVDGDTVFQRDTLRKIVRPFRDPKVGAVSGNAKVANRKGVLGRWQHIEYVIGFNLDRRMFDVFDCMATVPGAIGAFRRIALQRVGGVSEDTLAEDTDLTIAINRAGYRVAYEESAIAWTEAPASLKQLWRQRYRWCYGTMQAMWKHKPWFYEKNGRRCLTYLTVFQVLFPLLAPAVDVFALYALIFSDRKEFALFWLVFVGVQMIGGALALVLDKERLTPLWTVPLQQFVYRQLMYLIVIQSLVTAVLGSRMRWQTIRREGTFNAPNAVTPMVVTDTGPIALPTAFRQPRGAEQESVRVAGAPTGPQPLPRHPVPEEEFRPLPELSPAETTMLMPVVDLTADPPPAFTLRDDYADDVAFPRRYAPEPVDEPRPADPDEAYEADEAYPAYGPEAGFESPYGAGAEVEDEPSVAADADAPFDASVTKPWWADDPADEPEDKPWWERDDADREPTFEERLDSLRVADPDDATFLSGAYRDDPVPDVETTLTLAILTEDDLATPDPVADRPLETLTDLDAFADTEDPSPVAEITEADEAEAKPEADLADLAEPVEEPEADVDEPEAVTEVEEVEPKPDEGFADLDEVEADTVEPLVGLDDADEPVEEAAPKPVEPLVDLEDVAEVEEEVEEAAEARSGEDFVGVDEIEAKPVETVVDADEWVPFRGTGEVPVVPRQGSVVMAAARPARPPEPVDDGEPDDDLDPDAATAR